jgi:hypothetical protein
LDWSSICPSGCFAEISLEATFSVKAERFCSAIKLRMKKVTEAILKEIIKKSLSTFSIPLGKYRGIDSEPRRMIIFNGNRNAKIAEICEKRRITISVVLETGESLNTSTENNRSQLKKFLVGWDISIDQ